MSQGAHVLAPHDERVEHVAAVVDRDELQDLQQTGVRLHLHHRGLGVVGEAAEHRHAPALVRLELDVGIAEVVQQLQPRIHALGQLER